MKPVKVGICGLGTVGGGTYNVLIRNADEIARRAGRPIIVEQVGARRDNPDCDITGVSRTHDIFEVARNPEVDVLVELIGGYDVAYQLVMEAIANGKHVVTANKALIAVHGNEIFRAAAEKGVMVAFEAAVAGGIPVIKSLREGLGANRIQWLAGIINGTGNYILTHMRDEGRAFDDVLAEAQALGYAESDPTFDVEGIDAAHKLTILSSIAFGVPLAFEHIYTEGISAITVDDIRYAQELGYRLKHLGITRRRDAGVELRVHPTLVPDSELIAKVDGVMNAVLVSSDAAGTTLYYGAGAGALPTASSVVSDIIDVARSAGAAHTVSNLGFTGATLDAPVLPIADTRSAFYLKLTVADRPGVMASLSTTLSEHDISIEALIQKDASGGRVPIVLITNEVLEAQFDAAVRAIESADYALSDVTRIRVVSFS